MTMADSQLQQAAAALQRPDVPIRVSRFIGITPEPELRSL
jgi:hypothetical protein